MDNKTYQSYSEFSSFASEALREFHTSFEIPSNKQQENLRIHLLREEFIEVENIFEEVKHPKTMHELAKELADLLYVIYGTGNVFGIDLDIALQEVHKSNMSKLGEDGKPIRRADGKILKGPNYFEPDMSSAVL